MLRTSFLLAALMLMFHILACSDITEFEMTYSSSLYMISSDLETMHTISGIPGAASLLVYPGQLFVACTDGFVRAYDPETLEQTGAYQVGLPSPAGYRHFLFSPSENTAYLTSDQGKILELKMPSCEVLEEFSVCTAPVAMEITSGFPGNLWVIGGVTDAVYCLDLVSHKSLAESNFWQLDQVNGLAASAYHDSLLCSTSWGIFRLEYTTPGQIRRCPVYRTDGHAWGPMVLIPNDSNFVALKNCHGPSWGIGELSAYEDSLTIPPPPVFYNSSDVMGLMWLAAPGNDSHHVFAAGYLGSGHTTVYRYCYIPPTSAVDLSRSFSGYPLDLKSSDSGNLYLLTVEE